MLSHQSQRLGELQCHLLLPTSAARRALVLCHGFGAPGDDLVPLGGEICRRAPAMAADTLFVFPEAPLSPREFRPFGGRAWWPLDMNRLQAAMQEGSIRDLRKDQPERLPAARTELMSVLDELTATYDLPLERIVMGGFSQGSMLATDVTLRLPSSPAGLVIYSGTLLNESEWSELAPQRRGLPVLQSHGTEDPILSFKAAEWLRDLLMKSGLAVEFQSFSGGHTITAAGLQSTVKILRKISAPE